jgi:hypothetical protein
VFFSHPLKLEAKCSCGHRWKIRNAISVNRIWEVNSHDIEYRPVERLIKKYSGTFLTQPTEYAKTENEKPIKGPFRISKKEIKQIIKAIEAGDKDE